MATRDAPETNELPDDLNLINAGYVADLYEAYRADPQSVEPEWRARFDAGFAGLGPMAPMAGDANGTVVAAEVTTAAPAAPAEARAAPALPPGATPISGPAARLVRNMTASLDVPTATTFRDMEVSALEAARRDLNDRLAPRKLSFTHLIGFALVRAAVEQPVMTHAYGETDGQPYRLDPGGVNLGLAVDVERPDGSRFLVVPVIKGAGELGFAAFVDRYDALVDKARGNRLAPDDLAGGTITLTNPGTLGTTASVPRLMSGQGAIIATGAIRSVAERRLMTLTSTYDHRVIQGAESGTFLARVADLLAGADGFYEGIARSMGLEPARATQAEAAPAEPAVPEAAPPAAASATPSVDELRKIAAAMSLVDAYRNFGHLAAHLDPLGAEPPGDPALEPAFHGLEPDDLARIPAAALQVHVAGETLAEVLPALQRIYAGTIAYEVEHLANHRERAWLREVIESGGHREPMRPKERRALLTRLTAVEGLERFLHKAYLGQKRFSIEGLDAMVPMLDLVLEMAAEGGTRQAVIGMAHRGRLNVLAHIVGMSYESVLAEFEAGRPDEAVLPESEADDVKYHLGASGTFACRAGDVAVVLMPNPSHLEAVDPVVEGRARAEQTDRSRPVATVDTSRTIPILIHGDAAFAAQGVVAETFNLSRLAGYANGGTVHLIANNQVGFTTVPGEARSTVYSSDLAKGFDIPIIHVNADDPEACLAAVRLGMRYRSVFDGDIVIDLVGYRRYGHNEADEPAYTMPVLYQQIAEHPSARERYLEQLIGEGIVTRDDAAAEAKALAKDLAKRQASVRKKATEPTLDRGTDALPRAPVHEPATAVDAGTLRALNGELFRWPDGFSISPKLERQLTRRRDAVDGEGGPIEWGHAEALAFGSLLLDGVPIRLSGQDTVRGTFSQRHLTLFDVKTGGPLTPMQALSGARASFEVHNSPLSEYAAMGFEYGYAVSAPEALVIWEAQYGDFANGAEIIVDQFVIAGLAKWRQTSRLTLLLPHGYEGQGPEHSSARLERFLALGAEGNIRVVSPTTAAQYFHLLRRQAHHPELRPLVVMTPKSLLRLGEAASLLSDLADGTFRPVLDDPERGDPAAAGSVNRVILCSGKIFYDLAGSEHRERAHQVALVRVEQLYPFPTETLRGVLGRYPNAETVAWVQEEPRNMGARKFVLPKIRHLVPFQIPLGDISRPERSRPAEGYHAAHVAEQARIVKEAFGA